MLPATAGKESGQGGEPIPYRGTGGGNNGRDSGRSEARKIPSMALLRLRCVGLSTTKTKRVVAVVVMQATVIIVMYVRRRDQVNLISNCRALE